MNAAPNKHTPEEEDPEGRTEPGEEAGDDVDSDHHQHQDSPTQSIRESTSHEVDDGNAQHVGEGDGGEEDSLAAHQVKLCYYCVIEDRVIKAV